MIDRAEIEYRRKQSELTKKLWREGKYKFLIKPLITKHCANSTCTNTFQLKNPKKKKYCSQSCAAKVNNKKFIKRPFLKECQNCGQKLQYSAKTYCSIKCQISYQYTDYITKWKQGLVSGSVGITTKVLNRHIKRYLRLKYGGECSLCGWNEIHPLTGKVPIEVDHVDGNSDNNKEENLRLICPNCHSLTASFRNLNKGKGRAWRLTYIAEHKINF